MVKETTHRPSNGDIQTTLSPKISHEPIISSPLRTSSKRNPNIEELSILTDGTIEYAKKQLTALLQPLDLKNFMDAYWEKQVVCVNRRQATFYHTLGISSKSIDEMLRTNVVEFTKNIDITSYENGQRQTHNPDGRAVPEMVWDYYNDGCSIRLLNPQTFIPTLHAFNASLQEYFHCLVGANICNAIFYCYFQFKFNYETVKLMDFFLILK